MKNSVTYQPPKWAIKFLTKLCDETWVDEILGDLEEQFHDNYRTHSRFWTIAIYYWEVIRFIRPHILKSHNKKTSYLMPFHHLKISYRHLNRNKVYGLINVIGLSVGIASVLLIAIYVQNELSFDSFYKDSERIHRIALHRIYPDRTRDFASSVITLAPTLKENYPEVEAITRLHRLFFANEVTVSIEDKEYVESRYRFADEDFFKVFSHQFLYGDAMTALDAPDKVVLTESTALKYFGQTDVLDKTISMSLDTSLFIISGVIKDIPINSHIHFDLLGSTESVSYLENAIRTNSWMNPWVYTYVKLHAGIDPDEFEAQFEQLVDTYGKADLSQRLGSDYTEAGHKFEYFLQPIEDIHLQSKVDIEVEPNSDIAYIYLLSVIAFIILIISSINYINLSVARSPVRAKEVGIRKVVGVHRADLMVQFLTESTFICFISSILAIGIVGAILPTFNLLLNTALSLSILLNPKVILSFLAFILGVGLLSGFYPAMIMASLQPARILKGAFMHNRKGHWLRNGLTTLQFVISMIMIAGAVIVQQQMTFFQQKNLGFDQENIIVIRQAGRLGNNFHTFRNEVEAMPDILGIGGANGLLGDFHGSGVFKTSNLEASDLRANVAIFDDYLFDVMQFNTLEGRVFNPDFSDSLSIIINEATVNSLGLEDPIGEKFSHA